MKRTRKQAGFSGNTKRRRMDHGPQISTDSDTRRLEAASSKRQLGSPDAVTEHAVDPGQHLMDASREQNETKVCVEGPVIVAEEAPTYARTASGNPSFEAAKGRSEQLALDRSKQRWPKATEVGEDFKSVPADITDGSGEPTSAPMTDAPSKATETVRKRTEEQNGTTSSNISGCNLTSAPPGPDSSDVIASNFKPTIPALRLAAADKLAGMGEKPAPGEARHRTVQPRVFEAVPLTETQANSGRKKQKGRERVVRLPDVRGTRIRFDSEEPATAMALPSSVPLEEVLAADNQVTTIQSDDGTGESEDEAPETLSRISALQRNRALDKKVTEAVNQQDEATRSKRRKKQKRDEVAKRLKAVRPETGTGSVYSEIHASRPERLEDINSNPIVSTKPMVLPSEELPALLPDSVFEEVASTNPLTLDGPEFAKSKPKSKVFLKDAKPARDVKKGPLNVRVLEKTNPRLAPKASKQSEHLKESWLKRETATGKMMNMNISVQRRKINTGFLRRL